MGIYMPAKVKIDLLPYQKRLLLSNAKYLGLIGGTGCGKTYFIPRWLYVMMAKYPDNEWIVSSPTIGMIKRNPMKYILKFFDENEIVYELNKTDMILDTSLGTVYFISATDSDRMQGIHAKGIIGDEAGLYPKQWWDVAVQRTSFANGKILLTTTPYDPAHWLKTEFWEQWESGNKDYHIENPTSLDNPFYPVEEFEKAKMTLPRWKFELFYLAKWPEEAQDSLFKYKDIKACMDMDYLPLEDGNLYITVDIAKFGNDASVVCGWIDNNMIFIQDYYKMKGTELVGEIIHLAKRLMHVAKNEFGLHVDEKDITIIVDAGGLTNVGEMLEEQGYSVVEVMFGGKANDENNFANIRAEMYFKLAEYVENKQVKLVHNDELIQDLLVQKFRYDSKGRLQLVSKDDLRKELGRSTDYGDACALRFATIGSKIDLLSFNSL